MHSTRSHPLNTTDNLVAFCKAAGDELRLNVLRVLRENSFGVLELAHVFALGQSSLSHHLKVLMQAGLVNTQREGNAIFYRRSLAPATAWLDGVHGALLDTLDKQPLDAGILQRINEVHNERALASQVFFQRMADELSQRQDLIATLPQYRVPLLHLLDSLEFSADACALEVGPGDGQFLPDLARRFNHVLAVDTSQTMLAQAQAICTTHGLSNVQLQLADALHDHLPAADCVIVNMVLHHFAAPNLALRQLTRLLKPGGSLLICELCRHNQAWTQQVCGDLWLGFTQEELTHWASTAGLIPKDAVYLGFKNGFQIQLRHFARPEA